MNHPIKHGRLTKEDLDLAVKTESHEFQKHYRWLESNLSDHFFEEISHEELMIIVHHLIHFHRNLYFSHIQCKNRSIILCLDSADADVKILELFNLHGIKNYRSYLSSAPLPYHDIQAKLKITSIYFTQLEEEKTKHSINEQELKILFDLIKNDHDHLHYKDFVELIKNISPLFLSSLSSDQLKIALDLFIRAQTRDHCQYHLQPSSTHLILAWKNTPKHRFLYRVAKLVFRHNLCMNNVNITYINPYSKNPILLMSLGLHEDTLLSQSEKPDMEDLLKELVTLKYFSNLDVIENSLIDTKILTGNQGNLLRCLINLIHQTLLHADLHLYSVSNVEEAFCRHPELTSHLLKLFTYHADPRSHDLNIFKQSKGELLSLIDHLDTGQELNDKRRKEIFKQGVNIISHCLKTNYFRKNKSAFSFRLNPEYLNHVPFERSHKFPEIPYGIFFIQGMHFISFHIRFKDISRGGLRSIIPKKTEQLQVERNNIFAECYNLAYTQQKKNKDIPEGGSKAVILLEPFERLLIEKEIYKKELIDAGIDEQDIKHRLELYDDEHRVEYLYQAQRAFVHSLITLTNYSADGELRAKDIIDDYKKPEYIYLGPDENMYNPMIEWIASYSQKCHYPLGKAFISSKPSCGINHKEYGVTSLCVNVYMEEILTYLDIDPKQENFTIKMTGGPDGDVAGNQILNLYTHFPKTAKLLALIDGSGTIYDPAGLDLGILATLFKEGKPIAFYPPAKLNTGGFLLNTTKKKEETLYSQKTLLSENIMGNLIEKWISSSEMNHLLRYTVHQTPTDIFIPAGGRPRTLNLSNFTEFLDQNGIPTSKAIVEGANLYLTEEARNELEKLGVLIIKDSSANKGGVICSSLEVLTALTMPEEDFIKYKQELMPEILSHIKQKALDEAKLLLRTYAETGAPLTKISEKISEKINKFTYELLDYLETKPLSHDLKNPLMTCLINYCLPFLQKNYQDAILHKIPDIHQKAIISCYIASKLVYAKGLDWSPSIVDILPLVAQELLLMDE